MSNVEFKEIKPIGSFILDQKDIGHIDGRDGAYYHYKDVCTMLNRMKQQYAAFDNLETLLTRHRSIEIAEYRNDGEVMDYGVITDTKEFLAPTLSEAIEKASKK